jgi:hypothetical protein
MQQTSKEVKHLHDIGDYIEMFYTSQRLYSFSAYISPNDFERELTSLNGLSLFTGPLHLLPDTIRGRRRYRNKNKL